jgi:hypothetical protein
MRIFNSSIFGQILNLHGTTMKIKNLFAIAATLGFGLCVASASANIVFELGNHPQDDENNILFAAAEQGTTITGEVDHSGVAVEFTSLCGETLNQHAGGQASIDNAAGGSSELTCMFVEVPGYTFGDFILNLQNGHGDATVTVTTSGATFTYALGNGQNFLTITTTGGDTISSVDVTMSAGGGFDVFKQPRISQVCNIETQSCVPVEQVPEPQTLVLLGLALLSLVLVRRQRRA